MTAQDVIVRAHDLAEAMTHAKAIPETNTNFRAVRALVSTIDRMARTAHELQEPEPTEAGAD